MRQEDPGRSDPSGPLTWLKYLPFKPLRASDRLGWVGMQAARFRSDIHFELSPPPISYHRLVLFARPPQELDLRYEGVRRHVPPPAGSIVLVPAGTPAHWRGRGYGDSLCIYLDSRVLERVAAEAFDLDLARLTVPPLNGLDLPHLRTAIWAVDAEMATGGAGGGLAAESLANVLAVQLIRQFQLPRHPERGRDGSLPRGRLRSVIEYIEEHLLHSPSLDQIAAVARLSPYHFARQFKAATGLPPHQYVIMRRVERAKLILQAGTDLSLA